MQDTQFDVVVVGGGPGGYVAAIRAAQLGLKTALVEKRKTLGGTCLNIGCIPSKALLHSSAMFAFVKEHAAHHGISASKAKLDLSVMMKKKEKVVEGLVKGVGSLVSHKGVAVYHGLGRLKDPSTVEVTDETDKKETLQARHIILATGSSPTPLPFLKFDGKTIVSSDEAIAFDTVPEKLVVVGGGAIGLELGSVWARLGSEVTLLEFLPRIAPTFDHDVTRAAERMFKKQGIHICTSTKVNGSKEKNGKFFVTAEQEGKEREFEADKILVAVGRSPFTRGFGIEELGIKLNDRKRVQTDEKFRTNVQGIYAIGDLIDGPMLAHKAEDEGIALAEMIAGKAGHVNYNVIPNVIYTEPEIASVGIGEDEAREKGIEINSGKFPLSANGRALATDATDRFIKVVPCRKTDRVLGVQMLCSHASELIASAVAHMEYGGSAEDIARTVHAHPTFSEAFREAAFAVDKRAIHSL